MRRLTSVTIGVPNSRETAEYHLDSSLISIKDEVFPAYSGELLTDASECRFDTRDCGEQLRLLQSSRRRVLELGLGVEDPMTSAASPPSSNAATSRSPETRCRWPLRTQH